VGGELLGFIILPVSSCRRRRLGAKPSDIHRRDRPKQLQPTRRQGRQSDLVTIDAKSCINPKSDTSNPDTDEVAIGRNTNRFGSDRNYPVKLSATLDFHRLRRPRPAVSQTYASLIRSTRSLLGTMKRIDVPGRLSMHLDRPAELRAGRHRRRCCSPFADSRRHPAHCHRLCLVT
jgi:hypothetical protein